MVRKLFLATALLFGIHSQVAAEPAMTISIDATTSGKPISADLWGIFFEDINYAADGGLYAELVQNRSFEYQAIEQRDWHPLSFWEVVTRGDGQGSLVVDAGRPVHRNNPHYAVLDIAQVGDGVGISNPGFDGIAVQEGETYDVSAFIRQLYVERRWGGKPIADEDKFEVIVRLETAEGESLGETKLTYTGSGWQRIAGELVATHTEPAARLVLLSKTQGGIALDVVSLFPRKTFRNRVNGMRADLAETIAAMKPKFVRFPGGCLVHGNGLSNMYRWQDSIGPIEERRELANLWGYHQTLGLGYYEYFQFCEDMGAKPLPVVPAGVSCQNSGRTAGIGQDGLPLEEMPAYIEEVLDLIEWANGPADSEWGAKRAAAGHPEPFNLEYLGIGNEDHITPAFEERFRMINDALKEKHPEITVIGTVGPAPGGPDYEQGWRIANDLHLTMVDEHYYQTPKWFLENLQRYDAYDRKKSQVYLGEFAAHDDGRKETLRSALAEAAYMTHLERNGDIVRLASYAPLLGKRGRTQWNPDLIYFTNTTVRPTINYYVQQMFSANSGDHYVPAEIKSTTDEAPRNIQVSCVRDSATDDVILRLVNLGEPTQQVHVKLATKGEVDPNAKCTVLSGDPLAENGFGKHEQLVPKSRAQLVDKEFVYDTPGNSLSVIRIRQAKR
jgi:alpha-N-arabinofuranosidase